jgi:hypothetical protein
MPWALLFLKQHRCNFCASELKKLDTNTRFPVAEKRNRRNSRRAAIDCIPIFGFRLFSTAPESFGYS